MKKKDLDLSYEAFVEEMQEQYEEWDYDEEFDLADYMNERFSGRDYDKVDELIEKVYCPKECSWSRKKWQLGSEEEINLGDILSEIDEDYIYCYADFDDLCESVMNKLKANFEMNKHESIFNHTKDEIINYRGYIITGILNHVGRIKDDGEKELEFETIDNLVYSYEKLTENNWDHRWTLLEDLFKEMENMSFKDAYDEEKFDINKVYEMFDFILGIKEKIDNIKTEMDLGEGYGGRLLALNRLNKNDFNKLSLKDFKIYNENISFINNKEIYNAIIEYSRENEMEQEIEFEMDMGR